MFIGDSVVEITKLDSKVLIEEMGLRSYLLYSQIASVLFPAILYLLIVHFNDINAWIKLQLPSNRHFFMYSVMLLILAYPLIQLSADLNKYMPFTDFLKEESNYIESLMKEILVMNSPIDFFINLGIVALLPAIGEELFFRAIIQNELLSTIKRKDVAIILTAIIFSAFHLQFDGFLPRFFLGLILGYVYFWSRSIWTSVLLHFINNGLLVFSAFMMQDKIDEIASESPQTIPMYILLMSIIAVFVLRSKMIELNRKELNKDITLQDKI